MQDREVAWEAKLTGLSKEEIKGQYVARVPMGRLGTPEDVSRIAIFLASEESAYMTGQAINVGAGLIRH